MKFDIWYAIIIALFFGIWQIRYAYKFVEPQRPLAKKIFIVLGVFTMLLGFILFILCYGGGLASG